MTVAVERERKTWQCGLDRPVLVLNQGWRVHQVRTVREAFNLLCPDVGEEVEAKILDAPDNFAQYTWEEWSKLRPEPNAEYVLHGARQIHRVPEIVLLTHYDKTVTKGVRFSRRNIRQRDEGKCQYCGKRCEPDEWSIDHILPQSRGGTTTWLNVVLCCYRCNQKKNDKTPSEAGMKLLRQPFKPKLDTTRIDLRRAPRSWNLVLPKDFDHLMSEAYWSVELK